MEEFKKITGYELYEISNFGNVKNTKTKKILKPAINSCNGYFYVNLCKDGVAKKHNIHRLIALHFLENPENLPCIDHINRIKTDNSITNLRWISYKNNNRNKTKQKNTTSKYIGVYFDKEKNNFKAQIRINGTQKHLGIYKTENEAGQAYNNYILSHNLTEFFVLNDIQ